MIGSWIIYGILQHIYGLLYKFYIIFEKFSTFRRPFLLKHVKPLFDRSASIKFLLICSLVLFLQLLAVAWMKQYNRYLKRGIRISEREIDSLSKELQVLELEMDVEMNLPRLAKLSYQLIPDLHFSKAEQICRVHPDKKGGSMDKNLKKCLEG